MSNEKTLEQLEVEAADATKAIDALNVKYAELAKAKREAERQEKRKEEQRLAVGMLMVRIKEQGPSMQSTVGLLPKLDDVWMPATAWSENCHGVESKDLIQDAELRCGRLVYRNKIGAKDVSVIAVLGGTARLFVKGGWRRQDQINRSAKDWGQAAKKFRKILKEEMTIRDAKMTTEQRKAKVLTSVKTAVKAKYPEYQYVRAEYAWHSRNYSPSDHGYTGSDVNVEMRLTEDDYDSAQNFFDVEVKDGKMTSVVTRVTREALAIKKK